jgi:putative DNA primase/helicase
MTDDSDNHDLGAFADGMESDGYAPPSQPVDAPHPAVAGFPDFSGGESGDFDDDVPLPVDQLPQDLPSEIIVRCAVEPQNDTGNGKRLLNWFGDDLLHVREVGWHAWRETHWRREGGQEIATRCAQNTAARIALEADFISATPREKQMIEAGENAALDLDALEKVKEPSDAQKAEIASLERIVRNGEFAAEQVEKRQIARRKYAVSSGNAGKIRGMIDQALPHRSVPPADLDADKLAFNVINGTVQFICERKPDPDGSQASGFTKEVWSVMLRPHNRADNITKVAPVTYDLEAKCPNFDAAINRFQPIEAVRKFLQRYHGYAMTGLTGEQCLVFNYGTGSNWKSTFLEIVSRIMGDYSTTLNFESLAGDNQKSGSQATPDIARLPGARLVRASEPERNVHFKEALIKSLTGGEPMLVRHNFKDFFEFRPDFKLVLSGNHKPEIGGVDHGIWRRIRFVPWPVTIADHEKRAMDDVMAELWAEASGILNWLIAGTLDYLNGGLNTPQEVIDATAEYREEMDPVGNFIADCVVAVPAGDDGKPASVVYARKMFKAFQAWAHNNAVRPWKEKSFATAMSQKGFRKDKVSDGHRYLHVRLDNVPEEMPRSVPDHPGDAMNEEAPL